MRILITAILLVVSGCGGGGEPDRSAPSPTAPASASGKHLIYLHGKIIEDQGRRPTHPRFGAYEYQQILDTFGASGLVVSSDQRPAGTLAADAARSTAEQVRRLLDDGVPAGDITVVGFSKGGAIAVLTALELDNPGVNYVFIACCGPRVEELLSSPDEQIRGRMLSIFEASDAFASCSALFAHASPESVTDEIELHLGGGHGAFYRPHPEWVDPVIRWASGEEPRARQAAD